MKIFSIFTVDKYYKMNDDQLVEEAKKWNIRECFNRDRLGRISVQRKEIISQLIKKDQANNSRYAIFISVGALLVSIASIVTIILIN